MKLEDLQTNAAVRGILPGGLVTVVSVQWFGSEAVELTCKTPAGKVADELLCRDDEPRLEVAEAGRPWSVNLEIAAEVPSGAPDNVVRTVTENSRTLKFSSQGFEQE